MLRSLGALPLLLLAACSLGPTLYATPKGDDHGGSTSGSDDTDDTGDDHGGSTSGSDDADDTGDDHGGHGSDDAADTGDDHGGHGSD